MRYLRGIPTKSICFCIVLFFFFIFAGRTRAFAEDTVRINGSGTGLEMLKPLIEVYSKSHPGVTFDIQKPLGSSGAVKAVVEGALDIAVSSKPLRPDEAARGAKVSTFGKTPLAVITNKSVSKKNITVRELEAIYSGAMRKWKNNENIRVVLRPQGDIDTAILRGLSPGMDRAVSEAHKRYGMITATTDPESNDMVARTNGSIGTAGLAGILAGKIPVNILSLNGVMPTTAAVAGGRYPLSKDLNFVTTERLPEAAAKFLDFVYSERARGVVERIGVLVSYGSKAYR